jgi:hypothetical protein
MVGPGVGSEHDQEVMGWRKAKGRPPIHVMLGVAVQLSYFTTYGRKPSNLAVGMGETITALPAEWLAALPATCLGKAQSVHAWEGCSMRSSMDGF